jgi:ABC-type multidrug transport system ATPase subunit
MSTPALTLRDVRKTYANGFEALRGIDLEVAEGEFFALLGPNGAGKSTTIGIICSLVRKTSGMAQVFGHTIWIPNCPPPSAASVWCRRNSISTSSSRWPRS